MLEAAEAGDERARRVTYNYQHRPEWELYDVQADPQEQNNLYGKAGYEKDVKRLEQKLRTWMAWQGDKGIETEMQARYHQLGHLKKTQKQKQQQKNSSR